MTLRQLVAAVEIKRREQWDHTATILAMLYNINRPRGARVKSPLDWNPYRKRRRKRSSYTADVIRAAHDAIAAHTPAVRLSISQCKVVE